MWQLDSAATRASSGSTASARDRGRRTDDGAEEAGTVMPPSNDQVWARLYLPSLKTAPSRFQDTVAVYSCAMTNPPRSGRFLHERLVGGAVHELVELGRIGNLDLEE